MPDLAELEVCLSPALYHRYHGDDAIVVVVDIFRATSAMVTAFGHGAERVIPVDTLDEAREFKKKGYLVAAERDGLKPDFADFGNSPFDFMGDQLLGQTIVYSTTNGTRAIQMASGSHALVLGSFINHSAVLDWLIGRGRNVIILCAGWKERFSLEDSVYAGLLAKGLLGSGRFQTTCDSATACIDLWTEASKDMDTYKIKFSHGLRLKSLGLDDDIDYCLSMDANSAIPVFRQGEIRDVSHGDM